MEMKFFVTFLSLVLVTKVRADAGEAKRRGCSSPDNGDDQWDAFIQRFNKTYANCTEETMRRELRRSNRNLIASHNAAASKGLLSYKLAENELADRTATEYKSLLSFRANDALPNGRRRRRASSSVPAMPVYKNTIAVSLLSASVNWTAQGWVGPVVNQGSCGSCWAYSATGAIEAQYKNVTKTSPVIQLSQQNLISCSTPQGNSGCNGGNPVRAFWYVMQNGQQTAATYPSTSNLNGATGTCKYVASKSVVKLSGWSYVDFNNELALQQAIAKVGPVSVAVDASSRNFQLYSSGIFNYSSCSSVNLNHAVLAVGYGKDSTGKAYWLIKNSWGTSWGEKGYMRLARNAKNMCGVAAFASFPVVIKPTGR